jgi:hypothetical protein
MTTRALSGPVGGGRTRQLGLLGTSCVLALAVAGGCGEDADPASSPGATEAAPMPTSPGPELSTTPTVAAEPPASSVAGAAVTLIAAGDIGRCDSTADDATGALAASLPGLVATLGDTAYPDGTTQQLEECFGGSWGAVKDRIRFAVTGNHDVHTDDGAPLQAYMGSAAAREGRTWFSEDLGTWHVVVLDGNCGFFGDSCAGDSEQVRWLRDDLATSDARCTLVLMHQPRFSSGEHGDDGALGAIWDALYAADAELVLAGHDHDYERFLPQAPDGTLDEARGIVQVVVGTGGADLEAFRESRPNSVVAVNDAHGVLELTLDAGSWSFRFIDVAGVTRDAGGGDCH